MLISIQLGKNGLTEGFINALKVLFKKNKDIKINILKGCTREQEEAKQIAESICEKLGKNYKYRLIGYTIFIKKLRK